MFSQGLLVVEQHGVLEKTGDLSEKGNRLLVELLRVANVGRNDLVERKVAGIALCDLGPVLLGLDSKFTSDGILSGDNPLVDIFGSQSHLGKICRK